MPKGHRTVIQPTRMLDIKPLPRQRNKEERKAYLERKSVQRWIRRNADGLRVVDIRHVYTEEPETIEFAEILYVVKREGEKILKRRIVCGDPPPR